MHESKVELWRDSGDRLILPWREVRVRRRAGRAQARPFWIEGLGGKA
jgi:hypothetical protein